MVRPQLIIANVGKNPAGTGLPKSSQENRAVHIGTSRLSSGMKRKEYKETG